MQGRCCQRRDWIISLLVRTEAEDEKEKEKNLRVDTANHALLAVVTVDLTAVEPNGLGVLDLNDKRRGSRHFGSGDETAAEALVERHAWLVEAGLGDSVVARVELELDNSAGHGLDVVGRIGQTAVQADLDRRLEDAARGAAGRGTARRGGLGSESLVGCKGVALLGGIDGVHHAVLAVVAISLAAVEPDGLVVLNKNSK